ncbi:MAG: MgtC/SapB family protein [Bacteroidales bacterium]|nr:MgtC/SapB family protein [Bacteroidales bacterium]MDE7465899.1 MgtC/SapB family protein [Muribaculaceae bacterium]
MNWDEIIAQINSVEVNTWSSIFKLCLSLVLGCCVGAERKRKGQIAGVRTFALIAMGATLAMILSIYIPQEYLGLKNGDPGRIAAQVVTGIGFLGAGAIIQMKGSVRGLTTAAGIWIIAAIGMAVGTGLYVISIFTTILILFVLVGIEQWEHVLHNGAESRIVQVRIAEIIPSDSEYRRMLEKHHIHLSTTYLEYDYKQGTTVLNLAVIAKETADFMALFEDMRHLYPTDSITLSNQLK